MYPTLSDFIRDIFGIDIPLPIQMYGLLVASAFIIASFILMLEFRRKEREGIFQIQIRKTQKGLPATQKQLVIAGIVGFILGFKIVEAMFYYSDLVASPQEFVLSFRGNFFGGLIGAGLGAYLKYSEKKKEKLDKPKWVEEEIHLYQMVPNFLIVAAFFGLLGTKIFGHIENYKEFAADPIGELFSLNNLAFYGGLIVGGAALVVFGKNNGIKPLYMLDSGATAVALGYGVGRMGCHLAGDGCWGVVNTAPKPDWMGFLPDWLWSFNYPHNVNNEGIPIHSCSGDHCRVLEAPVFPTPLYETLMALLIFVILWNLRKRIHIPGMLFSIFMVMQGLERFFIEKIRVNVEYPMFGLNVSQAEIISTFSIFIGVAGIIFLWKRREKLKTYKDDKAWI
ncbi:MAG: hypothetical protein A2W91_16300 [Bacteroidetes bacterium GWF2_38_335]|nr:MAG: hypothetical protein A2W91_16300 [Bacteroidetes bacterium GWF2_38_335]OFY81251.1 MAG: hypothetical protein A2281_07275 [Bacteroidetes bacterium RIFOXYA12_FULL_38_20]HBS85368.1 diacylglyceryl transferase [Bacteroidales bacterium]